MDIFGFNVEVWQIYTVFAIVLMIAEITAPGFVLFPIGVGILATAPLTLFVTNTAWQLIILSINIVLSLFIFRRYVHTKDDVDGLRTNMDEIIGKKCVVETAIDDDLGTGYVKLYGDSWRALALDGKPIPKGTKVVIKELSGNKVIVSTIS